MPHGDPNLFACLAVAVVVALVWRVRSEERREK